jgi:Flp pilus assembly protein TadG
MPVPAPLPSPAPSARSGRAARAYSSLPCGERGRQKGQAIVLIAIMLAVIVGMAALAIDGSRAYASRRDLQAAVDAAALAAGDRMQQTASYSGAEQAAAAIFGTNLRLYVAPICSPAYGSPGALPYTVTCTYADGTALTDVVTDLGPQGIYFRMSAARTLQLQFARILSTGSSPTIAASGSSGVNNLRYAPVVEALGGAGCGGVSGSAITINGTGTLSITGDVVMNGGMSVAAGAVRVAGDVYARCQASVSGVTTACYPSGATAPCTYPDVAGAISSGYHFVDPSYSPPAVVGGSQSKPSTTVELSPGTYAVDPAIAGGKCYFLSAGVYAWQAGYTNNGGFVSNELKPPGEPTFNNNTIVSPHQFWDTNGVKCAGSLLVDIEGNGGQIQGTWGVEVTSVRTDSYAGMTYQRESAPSTCTSSRIHLFQTIDISVSNVPGADSYNIYLSSNGCGGPFGYVTNLPVSGPVLNTDTSDCPFVGPGPSECTLGYESTSIAAFALPFLPAPNIFAPQGTPGAYPPDGETAPLQPTLPNQNAPQAAPPAGDRANENLCDTVAAAQTTCPAAVTPGAVTFYLPSGSCLNDTNAGDNYVFSGYQYDWIAVYEPGAANPPSNTCANVMGAASDSAFIGLAYMPSASLSVPSASGFRSPATGGVMATSITFTGPLPSIVGGAAYSPIPPASRLVG